MKKRFKITTKPTSQNSSDEKDNALPILLADTSDSECGLIDEEIVEGDFVIVNIKGKSRVVPYIARIDSFEDDEYKSVFLKKIQSCGTFHKLVCIINEADEGSFAKADIVRKLFLPEFISGSQRKSHQFYLMTRETTQVWLLQSACQA